MIYSLYKIKMKKETIKEEIVAPEEIVIKTIEQINEEANQFAEGLSKKMSRIITPIIMKGSDADNDWCIGYFKNPLRPEGLHTMDLYAQGKMGEAGAYLIEACFLKEHSDIRFSSTDPQYDFLYFGLIQASSKLLSTANDFSKKKPIGSSQISV